ncbi:MAG: hypothetical protein ACMG6E_03970 [Candidatus Roizmanbacteria bacterium]
MEELPILPSNDFLDYLANEEFKIPRHLLDHAIREFKLLDNHTLLVNDLNDIPIGPFQVVTKSGIKMTVDLKDNGYLNSDPNAVILADQDDNLEADCLVFLDGKEEERFINFTKVFTNDFMILPNDVFRRILFNMNLNGRQILSFCNSVSKDLQRKCQSIDPNAFQAILAKEFGITNVKGALKITKKQMLETYVTISIAC